MQKEIEKATPVFIEQIIDEIEENFNQVLVDQYGNYFCQKLFPILNDEQKMRLLTTLK